jgi:hypothetical protein
MPSDIRTLLPIGTGGLNLRASAPELGQGELVDTLNWQLDPNGALVKRTGFSTWSSALPSPAIELMTLVHSGGTTYYVAQCENGQVYYTTDGITWTSIDSGLSGSVPVGWAQYLDKLYWCDGVASFRQWDGTTLTAFAGMPKGVNCCVWRNRLFVAVGRTVYWSKAGDPTDFSTFSLNTVSFPDDTNITALVTIQNISSGIDGSDGVLVFTKGKTHRIYDDTDNVAGAVVGGANNMVDAGTGCVGRRSTALLNGRVVFLGESSIFSTDGHSSAVDEGVLISPLMNTLAWGQATDFKGFVRNGRYYLAFAQAGATANTRLLELYADLPRTQTGHPWMAHDVPLAACVTTQDATGQEVYFVDASTGDGLYVRKLFHGGYDADGSGSRLAISALARTGAQLFGLNGQKRVRRVELYGRGSISVSVSPDLASASGESRVFDMRTETRVWNPADQWGTGVWGAGGGSIPKTAYYNTRGRYLTLEFTESSQDTSINDRALGYPGAESGGAAALSVVLKLTPLDAD